MKKEYSKQNLVKLLGGNPEMMSREEFNSALENAFTSFKKKYKDPFEAKTKLNEALNEAFVKDFTSYEKDKDVNKLTNELLTLYGLTPEQIKKSEINLNLSQPFASGQNVIGGFVTTKEKLPIDKEKQAEYLEKQEFTPQMKIFGRKDKPDFPAYVEIPHEARHLADLLQHPYTYPYQEHRELISLEDLPSTEKNQVLESIKKDPSLSNILEKSKSLTHFQPILVTNPPTYSPYETIFSRTHPFVSTPEVVPPEQPTATGIFANKEEAEPLSLEQLNEYLYGTGDNQTFDPLRKRFRKVENLFKQVTPSKANKPAAIESDPEIEKVKRRLEEELGSGDF